MNTILKQKLIILLFKYFMTEVIFLRYPQKKKLFLELSSKSSTELFRA